MNRIRFRITGLECTASTRVALERRIVALPGVADAYLNPATETLQLELEDGAFSEDQVLAILTSFGARVLRSWSEPEAAEDRFARSRGRTTGSM